MSKLTPKLYCAALTDLNGDINKNRFAIAAIVAQARDERAAGNEDFLRWAENAAEIFHRETPTVYGWVKTHDFIVSLPKRFKIDFSMYEALARYRKMIDVNAICEWAEQAEHGMTVEKLREELDIYTQKVSPEAKALERYDKTLKVVRRAAKTEYMPVTHIHALNMAIETLEQALEKVSE